MRINQLNTELEGQLAELIVTRRLVEDIKQQSITSERKIIELELKEKIAIEESNIIKKKYEARIETISKSYIEFINQLGEKFSRYKQFVQSEFEIHENCREGLERLLKEKTKQVEGLHETLSIPRNHFKNIEKLTVQQILVQKDQVLDKMSREMAIPKEVLVSKMYAKEAKKEALKLV